jgi:Na+/alanine symporter
VVPCADRGRRAVRLFNHDFLVDTAPRPDLPVCVILITDIVSVLFLAFVVVGSSMQLGSIIDFSDAMIFAMAFPNIIGICFLLPEVKREMNEYWADYKAGTLKKFGKAANRA